MVHATFDGEPYDGQVVKWEHQVTLSVSGKIYVKKIGKTFGDEIMVTLKER